MTSAKIEGEKERLDIFESVRKIEKDFVASHFVAQQGARSGKVQMGAQDNSADTCLGRALWLLAQTDVNTFAPRCPDERQIKTACP